MRSRRFSLGAVLVLLIGWALFTLAGSEGASERVRRALDELETLARVEVKKPPVEQVFVAAELSKRFTDPVSYTVLEDEETRSGSLTRREVTQQLMAFLPSVTSLEVSLEPSEVREEGSVVSAVVEVSVLGALEGHEGKFFEHHRARVRFEADGLLVSSIEHLENLRN